MVAGAIAIGTWLCPNIAPLDIAMVGGERMAMPFVVDVVQRPALQQGQ